MAAENYYAILRAVADLLDTVPELAGKVIIRKGTTWEGLLDTVPCVVVAPRDDLGETIADLQFGKSAHIVYDVFVLVVANADWSLDVLRWRLKARESVRLLLYQTTLDAASAVFDVDYEPSPGLPQRPPENLDVSAQLFRYKADEARAS